MTAYELVCQDDLWLNKQIGIRGLEMKHELLGEMVSPVSNEVKLPKSIQKTSALAKFSSDKNGISARPTNTNSIVPIIVARTAEKKQIHTFDLT